MAWKRSGLSAREFARRHGVKAGTLSWWRWRLGAGAEQNEEEQQSQFIPVTIESDAASSCAWELSTASGDVLRVHEGIERDALTRVLAAITRRRQSR